MSVALHGTGCHWCETAEQHAGPAECTPDGRHRRVEHMLAETRRARPLVSGARSVRVNALDRRGRVIW